MLCTDASIALTTTVRSADYPIGSQPILGLTVTNKGNASCVRDVSGALQVFTVYNAKQQRVWSTVDCFPGQGSEARMLDPGGRAHFDIKWAGTSSHPGCAGERVPVPTGAYTAVARLGKLTAAPIRFNITD